MGASLFTLFFNQGVGAWLLDDRHRPHAVLPELRRADRQGPHPRHRLDARGRRHGPRLAADADVLEDHVAAHHPRARRRVPAVAGAVSIDDYIITSFVAGPTFTFPRRIFDSARIAIPPQVHVLATMIMLVAIADHRRRHASPATAVGRRPADGRALASLVTMSRPEAPRIALAPEGAPAWMAEAVSDGGGHVVAAGRGRGDRVGRPPRPRGARRGARRRRPTPAGCSCRSPASRTSSTSSTTTASGRAARACTPSRSPRWRSRWRSPGCAGFGTYARAHDWTRAAGPQPARRAGHDPRRRRDHRVARAAAAAVGLPHHRRAPHGQPPRRRRRRARGRPLRRRPAGRRPRRARPRPDARDRGHHRRRRAVADGGPRLAGQRRPRPPRRHRRPRRRAARRRRSAAPGSTSPIPSRCPHDHPLWTLPNCLITPHVGNTPEMARPLLAERIRANVRRFADGEELIGPSTSTPGTDVAGSPAAGARRRRDRRPARRRRPAPGRRRRRPRGDVRSTRSPTRPGSPPIAPAGPSAGSSTPGSSSPAPTAGSPSTATAFQQAARAARGPAAERRARRRAGRAAQGARRVRPRRPDHVDAGGAGQAAGGARLAGPGVRAGRALLRARGQRDPRRAPPRHRGAAPLPRRRGAARPRRRRVLAQRRHGADDGGRRALRRRSASAPDATAAEIRDAYRALPAATTPTAGRPTPARWPRSTRPTGCSASRPAGPCTTPRRRGTGSAAARRPATRRTARRRRPCRAAAAAAGARTRGSWCIGMFLVGADRRARRRRALRTERRRRRRTTCSSRVRASSSRPTATPGRSTARARPASSSSARCRDGRALPGRRGRPPRPPGPRPACVDGDVGTVTTSEPAAPADRRRRRDRRRRPRRPPVPPPVRRRGAAPGLATAALVCGIAGSALFFLLVLSVVAVVLGAVAAGAGAGGARTRYGHGAGVGPGWSSGSSGSRCSSGSSSRGDPQDWDGDDVGVDELRGRSVRRARRRRPPRSRRCRSSTATSAHQGEVFFVERSRGSASPTFPGDEAVAPARPGAVRGRRVRGVRRHARTCAARSRSRRLPARGLVGAGDRIVVCLAVPPDGGDLTSSVRGSGS